MYSVFLTPIFRWKCKRMVQIRKTRYRSSLKMQKCVTFSTELQNEWRLFTLISQQTSRVDTRTFPKTFPPKRQLRKPFSNCYKEMAQNRTLAPGALLLLFNILASSEKR